MTCGCFGGSQLDKFLGSLGVFLLVVNGDTLAGLYKFRQVGVEGVVREISHLGVSLFLESNAKLFGDDFCIFPVGLIEIAYTEEQYRVGMLGFQLH